MTRPKKVKVEMTPREASALFEAGSNYTPRSGGWKQTAQNSRQMHGNVGPLTNNTGTTIQQHKFSKGLCR